MEQSSPINPYKQTPEGSMDMNITRPPVTKPTLIYVREFCQSGDSVVLPGRMINTFKKLTALLHKVYKKDSTSCDLHIHLEDTVCHGVISNITWDEGVHLEAAETERVELFAHFIPKAFPTALASRGLSTPLNDDSNKVAALTEPLTTPRQPNSIRTLDHIVAEDIEGIPSSAIKRKLSEVKRNALTPRKRRGANQADVSLAEYSDNSNNPESVLESTLKPTSEPILVKVSFSYVAGTANVLRNFRTHTSSLYLKSPVGLVRSIVSGSVTHSINASSRLHSYRNLLEYDVFITTTQAGAVERPLDSVPLLRDHISELRTLHNIVVRTYIYLAKGGKRYARFEDAVADALVDTNKAIESTRTAEVAPTPGKSGSATIPLAPISRGIIIGQLPKSSHKDGRKNAVVAYLSVIGSRILCSVIDEDLEGNPLGVIGPARITPENVDLLEQYASLGREGMKVELKRKLMKLEGATGKEAKGSKAAVVSVKGLYASMRVS
ncbi:hypothetical protein AOQ84DRAFT_359148 [Glonium stellatum]|uniref:Uncharacterized protein n=1 Tax=Glonium stellatum TaxID=574774 RepID=A0A8E2FBL1_9PEZI|nr:hypothetical protein AOQ84DRAFT_359148 [Glonium stellatum]